VKLWREQKWVCLCQYHQNHGSDIQVSARVDLSTHVGLDVDVGIDEESVNHVHHLS